MIPVTLAPRQLIAPLFMGVAVFLIYTSANRAPVPLAVMASLAIVIHMTALGIRDASFKALLAAGKVGPKDLYARCAMVVFDAIVLFGIFTGAGVYLPLPVFVSLIVGLALVLPMVVAFMTRGRRADTSMLEGWPITYWAPPVFLMLLAMMISLAGGVIAPPDVMQPFIFLIVLSASQSTPQGITLEGHAKTARHALLVATMILVIANYVLLS